MQRVHMVMHDCLSTRSVQFKERRISGRLMALMEFGPSDDDEEEGQVSPHACCS
jgi:hypothetical protein